MGYLGSRHAARLAEGAAFRLVAVQDSNPERAEAVARELGCRVAATPQEALAGADAAVVATSTASHRIAVEAALAAGCHVLVEKPLTARLDSARALVREARDRNLVLQVGQVERFNPALRSLKAELPAPLFVESHRLAPLVPRNLDLDVVQDLMVHDLDLALAFVGEEPDQIDAVGVPVITERVDIANARLRFPSGAVANLTASRVSLERTRKFRMFIPGTYVSADCAKRTSTVYRLTDRREDALRDILASGSPLEMLKVLDRSTVGGTGEDALVEEHKAFAAAIRGEPNDGVPGEEALRTLRAMVRVEAAIAAAKGG